MRPWILLPVLAGVQFPATADQPARLEVVVVTATFREVSLAELPASVSVLDLTFLGNLAATQTLIYATLASLLLTVLALLLPMVGRAGALRRIGHCVDEARLPYVAQRHTGADAHLLGAVIVRDGIPWMLHERVDWKRLAMAR